MAKKQTKKKAAKLSVKKAPQKLTKVEAKRVAIAKDALAQIKAEKVEVLSDNGYVVSSEFGNEIFKICEDVENEGKYPSEVELRTYLDGILNSIPKCEVCAKGALCLSAIRKFNNFSLEKAKWDGVDDEASQEIRKIFGKSNADLIESYFEKNDPHKEFKDGDHWVSHRWSHGYEDKDRLILILKNVIANKGTFKPKQLKWASVATMQELDIY